MDSRRLKELRLAKGLTQAELGRLVGVGKSAVSQYESGAREPDTAVLVRLAGSLGTTTDWLLGRDRPADLVREPQAAYDAGPAPPSLAEYLAELTAQVEAIASAEDRHAVLEMARFLAQKKHRPPAEGH